ncbi:MAG TPA: hypothetical protein VHY56_14180 [Candidatus Binataceae bacterium]|nr:hypothetical protein [Candidatus Binataceae bacterium]
MDVNFMDVYMDWLTRLTNQYGGILAVVSLAAVVVPGALWLWNKLGNRPG